MKRRVAVLAFFAIISVLAVLGRTLAYRAAAREAEGTKRITAQNAEDVFAAALPAGADAKWLAKTLAAHAREVLAKAGPRADLESLVACEVGGADLPPADKVPLAKLRARLAQLAPSAGARLQLFDSAARADLAARLADARIVTRSTADFLDSFDRALLLWVLALAIAGLLALGALSPASRSPDLALFAVSSLAVLTLLGMILVSIAVGPLSGPPAAEKTALHLLLGIGTGGIALILWPWIVRAGRRLGVEDVLFDGRAALAAAAVLLLVLAVLGHGPRGSGARINLTTPLGVFQPLEVAKLFVVLALAQHVGRHRTSFALVRRRPKALKPWLVTLFAPFLFALLALTGSAWGLGDFGTVLVLAPTLALIVIGASGSGIVAAVLTSGALAAVPLLVLLPWPTGSKVFVRLMAWLVPDVNGLPGGDQLALAQQAIASGGWFGSAWPAMPNSVPAGTTDLPVALLIERFGVVALVAFVSADLLLVYSGVAIGARMKNRRAEIRYVPMALAFLIAVQTVVALAGLSGMGPLSGIVTPFLSEGGTAMVVFSAAALLIARMGAVAGGAPEPGDDPLPRGLLIGVALVGAGVSVALFLLAKQATGDPRRLTDPIPTELADGRIAPRWSPLLHRIMPRLEPVPIVDRRGRTIASGRRAYPYGAAMAPLAGVARRGIAPLSGTLEALARQSHARFPLRATGGDLVEACTDGQLTSCSPAGVIPAESPFRSALLGRIEKRHLGARLRMRPFLAPNFGALASPLREGPSAVDAALERIRADVPLARATVDADLQADAYPLLLEAMRASKATLGAVVMRDAETGEVLARVSSESIDPEAVDAAAYADPSITGAFGTLRDHAVHYAVPPGSTFKPITAFALLDTEEAERFHPEPCLHHVRRGHRGWQGNLRLRQGDSSGWIADFGIDRPHGALDLAGALVESCNVFFAQAGLAVGPDRLRELVSRIEIESFSVPDGGGIELAAAAIGQGKTLMTADQLSLAYAAIAGGGTTRACPLLTGRDGSLSCRDVHLATPKSAEEVANALRRVVTMPKGTGVRAREPKGASFAVYGKTGTAEQDPVRGEGVAAHAHRDHAWFAGWFAGPNNERIAFAILLARGGTGGKAAAPLAPKLGALLEQHGYFDVGAVGSR